MSIDYDPYDERWRSDPYPKYRELRDEAPVHYSEASNSWTVSRHADVLHVLSTPEVFSSNNQKRRTDLMRGNMGVLGGLGMALRFMMKLRVGPWVFPGTRMLIQADGEIHTAMRKIVNRGFTPRRISVWEERAIELSEQGLAGLRERGDFELVSELAIPLPRGTHHYKFVLNDSVWQHDLGAAPVWRFWQDPDRRRTFWTEASKNLLFLAKWMGLAYLLEALMVAYVPADMIASVVGGDGVLAVIIGAPAYLNGYAAPPLVAGLIGQGMSPGAGMAFITAGAMTCIPAMAAVWAIVKPNVFAAYLSFAFLGAVIVGLMFGATGYGAL